MRYRVQGVKGSRDRGEDLKDQGAEDSRVQGEDQGPKTFWVVGAYKPSCHVEMKNFYLKPLNSYGNPYSKIIEW